MHQRLEKSYNEFAAVIFDKQLHLNDLVGELSWQFDMDAGTLAFDDAYEWKVQVLGTESERSKTWLWSWANTESEIPHEMAKCARSLQRMGERKGIAELTTKQIPVSEVQATYWAYIACGLCEANAYYRGPYDGGAVFLLIRDERFPVNNDPALLRLATVFPQAIASIPISDQPHALSGYAAHLGLTVETSGQLMTITDPAGEQLTAEFDDAQRMVRLSGNRDQD